MLPALPVVLTTLGDGPRKTELLAAYRTYRLQGEKLMSDPGPVTINDLNYLIDRFQRKVSSDVRIAERTAPIYQRETDSSSARYAAALGLSGGNDKVFIAEAQAYLNVLNRELSFLYENIGPLPADGRITALMESRRDVRNTLLTKEPTLERTIDALFDVTAEHRYLVQHDIASKADTVNSLDEQQGQLRQQMKTIMKDIRERTGDYPVADAQRDLVGIDKAIRYWETYGTKSEKSKELRTLHALQTQVEAVAHRGKGQEAQEEIQIAKEEPNERNARLALESIMAEGRRIQKLGMGDPENVRQFEELRLQYDIWKPYVESLRNLPIQRKKIQDLVQSMQTYDEKKMKTLRSALPTINTLVANQTAVPARKTTIDRQMALFTDQVNAQFKSYDHKARLVVDSRTGKVSIEEPIIDLGREEKKDVLEAEKNPTEENVLKAITSIRSEGNALQRRGLSNPADKLRFEELRLEHTVWMNFLTSLRELPGALKTLARLTRMITDKDAKSIRKYLPEVNRLLQAQTAVEAQKPIILKQCEEIKTALNQQLTRGQIPLKLEFLQNIASFNLVKV